MSHFYVEQEGEVQPRHFVPMTSRPGELRPTRITDVRKAWKRGEMWVPSVTTVLNTLDKAALKNWLIDQHLQIAHQMPHGLTLNEYIAECKRRTEMELQKAPDAGTDVHKVLEDYMQGREAPSDMLDHCKNVESVLNDRCGAYDWLCERRFTDGRGFGGCADLSRTGVMHGEPWVVDYKTKQTAEKFKPGKMVYPDHSRQLAAYREGMGTPKARCANVFICIETGEVDFHEHTEAQLQNGWGVFKHALAIWQITNDYPTTISKAA